MAYNRGDFKANTLIRVVTRIDYADIFEVDPSVIKSIYSICEKYRLSQRDVRMLDTADFVTNDPKAFRTLPSEYIEEIKSHVFFSEDGILRLEVNQLFLRVIQNAEERYEGYDLVFKFLQEVLDVHIQNLDIIRVSIKKANQIFFKDIQKIERYFTPEIIQLSQFRDVDLKQGETRSRLVQSFNYKDCFVNFLRVLDSGLIDTEKYFRLYFDYEFYLRERVNNSQLIGKIYELNNNIFDLYMETLTEEAKQSLINGERLGDL